MVTTRIATEAYVDAEVDAGLAGVDARIAGRTDFESGYGVHFGVGLVTSTTLSQTVANNGISIRWRPSKDRTIRKFKWFSGGATGGNYDVGILDAAGTRLWSKGSTPWPGANLANVETVPDLAVTAGIEYLLVLAASDATATFRGLSASFADEITNAAGLAIVRAHASIFPIPATVTLGSAASTRIPRLIVTEA